MRKFIPIFVFVIAFLALCGTAIAGSDAREQIQKATEVLNEIMQTPDQGIPQDSLSKAVCVGIVPSQVKFALGIGGTYGRGVLVCRKGGNGPWGGPSFFTLGGANIGFQIGGEATDVVFLVMNPKGVRKLLEDNVKLGAEVGVAAGPVGRSAQGATDAQMTAEILSYSRSRGLFAGVSLEGAVLKPDKDAIQSFYGRSVDPEDILIKGKVQPPPEARELVQTLTKYSPHGGAPFTAA